MTGSVRGTVTGVVRSVQAWLANNMWAALGAGVTGLLGLVSQGGGIGPGGLADRRESLSCMSGQ